LTGSFPQKQKSSAPGLLIGHRHFIWLSSNSVHPHPLEIGMSSTGACVLANAAISV
jgi:hypothetical protein